MTLPIIVGLGSHHGDDQAGWLVLDWLREQHYPQAKLKRVRHPAGILDVVGLEAPLIICDASAGNGRCGSIRYFQWPSDRLMYERPAVSHDLTLGDILQLGQSLNCLPKSAGIWAIEGECWSVGAEPSAIIRSAACQVADAIIESCRTYQEHYPTVNFSMETFAQGHPDAPRQPWSKANNVTD